MLLHDRRQYKTTLALVIQLVTTSFCAAACLIGFVTLTTVGNTFLYLNLKRTGNELNECYLKTIDVLFFMCSDLYCQLYTDLFLFKNSI